MPFQKGQPGGPGRPKKHEKYGAQIAATEDRIADRLAELVDNLFALAAGVTVREEGPDGPRIYTRPPDRKANEYLIDRILGKPTQAVEADLNVTDPDQLIARFEASVDRIYGDDE